MLRYFISVFFLLGFIAGHSQSKSIDLQPKDTVVKKESYGLRVGADLSKLALSFFNDDYTGLELVGDYRLTQKLFLAAELGNEDRTKQEDLYNFTSSGSYIKAGVDYNTYQNWYGMDNTIFLGGRYAVSTFSQTLNDYSVFDSNRYWNADGFADGQSPGREFSGLNASWLELVFGTKVELFANIYLGASVRLDFLVTQKQSDEFPTLWIPGFNKVTDGSNFGASYNYSISYFIPLYKKAKKATKKEVEK
ncbi:hypothetical protein SB49_01665 [Sediminicola sp. YIK13]|uniref:DUF6048 family protein n=1 Tax=Sediminicola sp. YIK13 TaxID=1453352 RepID=UPI0007201704|nr:DUF6048 family protein [Sediminicola sp. YIK13]ALM06653.1 hypothetical protein SB49_01665 [Sediminicola sp. YIK13]